MDAVAVTREREDAASLTSSGQSPAPAAGAPPKQGGAGVSLRSASGPEPVEVAAQDATKPCKVCGYDMPAHVKQCQQSKCGAFQDGFRRWLSAIAPFQVLLLMLGGILGILFNSQLQSWAVKKAFDPDLDVRVFVLSTKEIVVQARNTGAVGAELVGVKLWMWATDRGEGAIPFEKVITYRDALDKLLYPSNVIGPGQVWQKGRFEPPAGNDNLFSPDGDICKVKVLLLYKEIGSFSSSDILSEAAEGDCE